jgi:hypothetical protein
MNLVQIRTNEFFPQFVSLVASEGHRQSRPHSYQKLGRRDQSAVPSDLSRPSRSDPFPPVFVMESAENHASFDLAVLGQGMSLLTLQR